ncbi:MAG: hypothetical protein LBB49_02550 [Gracilibacteraceae bacterium]|nr:hypothetical protein [Gracilibacteraceae bacterium]
MLYDGNPLFLSFDRSDPSRRGRRGAVDNGQWTMRNTRWWMDNGQW